MIILMKFVNLSKVNLLPYIKGTCTQKLAIILFAACMGSIILGKPDIFSETYEVIWND